MLWRDTRELSQPGVKAWDVTVLRYTPIAQLPAMPHWAPPGSEQKPLPLGSVHGGRQGRTPLRALVPKGPGLAQVGVGNGFDQVDFANSEQSEGLTLCICRFLQVILWKKPFS